MDPFSLLESWLIREAGFWILTRRKERDFGVLKSMWIWIDVFFWPESNRGPYGLLKLSSVPRSPPLSYGDGWITENPLGPLLTCDYQTTAAAVESQVQVYSLSRGRGQGSRKREEQGKEDRGWFSRRHAPQAIMRQRLGGGGDKGSKNLS